MHGQVSHAFLPCITCVPCQKEVLWSCVRVQYVCSDTLLGEACAWIKWRHGVRLVATVRLSLFSQRHHLKNTTFFINGVLQHLRPPNRLSRSTALVAPRWSPTLLVPRGQGSCHRRCIPLGVWRYRRGPVRVRPPDLRSTGEKLIRTASAISRTSS